MAMNGNERVSEVNSTGLQKREKSAEEKAKWAAYIRDYRKRRKLAAEVAKDLGIPDATHADQSSPVEAPSAS